MGEYKPPMIEQGVLYNQVRVLDFIGADLVSDRFSGTPFVSSPANLDELEYLSFEGTSTRMIAGTT